MATPLPTIAMVGTLRFAHPTESGHGSHRVLVRVRQHLFLSSGHAHREAGGAGGCGVALAALPARADLPDARLDDSPFNIFAAKGRYMWRDLTRICEAEGIPLKLPPAKFPQNGLKAARLALAGEMRAGRPPSRAPCSPRTTPSRRTSARTQRSFAILDALGVDAKAAFAAADRRDKDASRRPDASREDAGRSRADDAHRRRLFEGRAGRRVGDEA